MSSHQGWSNGSGSKRSREEDYDRSGHRRRTAYPNRGDDQRRWEDESRVRSEVRGRDYGFDRKNLNIDSTAASNGQVGVKKEERLVTKSYFEQNQSGC